jgi:hypothetical protein
MPLLAYTGERLGLLSRLSLCGCAARQSFSRGQEEVRDCIAKCQSCEPITLAFLLKAFASLIIGATFATLRLSLVLGRNVQAVIFKAKFEHPLGRSMRLFLDFKKGM